MALIGQMLLQSRAISLQSLEEALAAQVIHGGRLGTNLVEMGQVGEDVLADALGKQHGIASASGELTPTPDALKLLDPNYADDKDVLPLRIDGKRLSLLVINPGDIGTIDHVAAIAGMRVVPVIIPEFRMAQLQRRHCRAFRPVRAIDMMKAPSRRAAAEPSATPGDLLSEDEFQSLYARALSGGTEDALPEIDVVTEPEAPLPEIPIEQVLATPPAFPAVRPEAPPRASPMGPTELGPPRALPPRPMPAPSPQGPIGVGPSGAPPTAAPFPPAAPAPRAPARRAPPQIIEPQAPPVAFAEAQTLLAQINNRDDIARTVLRFASGVFRRALLLRVQGDVAVGWHGVGPGVYGRAHRVGVPLVKPSPFRLVRDSFSHFIGPLRREAPTVAFLKLLGSGEPKTAVIMPILALGRVVNFLYCDNGPGELTPPNVAELLILAQRVGRSYEELVALRRKAPPMWQGTGVRGQG